jgi:ubiquinone biosynthesis monooxygenase Coq7
MWDEEKVHLAKFNELIPKYKVRPSALLPVWNVAGYALGKTCLFIFLNFIIVFL